MSLKSLWGPMKGYAVDKMERLNETYLEVEVCSIFYQLQTTSGITHPPFPPGFLHINSPIHAIQLGTGFLSVSSCMTLKTDFVCWYSYVISV